MTVAVDFRLAVAVEFGVAVAVGAEVLITGTSGPTLIGVAVAVGGSVAAAVAAPSAGVFSGAAPDIAWRAPGVEVGMGM